MAKLGPLRARLICADICPPVYNQGQIGSCTANALLRHRVRSQETKTRRFCPSRLFIYYNERSMEHSVSIDNGAEIRDGIKASANKARARNANGPMTILRPIRRQTFGRPAPSRRRDREVLLHGREKIPRPELSACRPPLTQMKGCLADGYPFVFWFTVMTALRARRLRKQAC